VVVQLLAIGAQDPRPATGHRDRGACLERRLRDRLLGALVLWALVDVAIAEEPCEGALANLLDDCGKILEGRCRGGVEAEAAAGRSRPDAVHNDDVEVNSEVEA
jgi:hypothetical protein